MFANGLDLTKDWESEKNTLRIISKPLEKNKQYLKDNFETPTEIKIIKRKTNSQKLTFKSGKNQNKTNNKIYLTNIDLFDEIVETIPVPKKISIKQSKKYWTDKELNKWIKITTKNSILETKTIQNLEIKIDWDSIPEKKFKNNKIEAEIIIEYDLIAPFNKQKIKLVLEKK